MSILKNILSYLGLITSYIWPLSVSIRFQQILNGLYTGYLRRGFHHLGRETYFTYKSSAIEGQKCITIGDNTFFGKGLRLTANVRPQYQKKEPQIVIGNDCNFGERNHITAFNDIIIGSHVLTGTNVLITDNAHGTFQRQELDIPPMQRNVTSKGVVMINDNVWIGSNACIMPGVTIGRGAIIGANAVVTKDVPPYALAAGNPARVIKIIE